MGVVKKKNDINHQNCSCARNRNALHKHVRAFSFKPPLFKCMHVFGGAFHTQNQTQCEHFNMSLYSIH